MVVHSRNKGKAGEREAAELLRHVTGRNIQRKVRQHDGDSDLVGLEPWCIEVKRNETLPIRTFWLQAVVQAEKVGGQPLLLFRRNRQPWRAVWSVSGEARDYVESDVETWWRCAGQAVIEGS